MACGERFAFLLPPACEGYVLGALCSGEDYEVGREHVSEIRRRLIRSWNEIMALENAAQAYPVTERYRAEHDAWLAREEALGWQLIASSSDFEAMATVAQDGVCLLDQMVADGEAHYGTDAVTVPAEPYTPPTRLDQLTDLGRSAVSLAALTLLGLVAYKVWDRYG